MVEPADPKTTLRTHLESIVETEQVQPLFDKLYGQFLEITLEGGSFEKEAEGYVSRLTTENVIWQGAYDLQISDGYVVISRPFTYAGSDAITGKWFIPINENDPVPSFSIDHIHDWRFRKFLVTFHHLYLATKDIRNIRRGTALGEQLVQLMNHLDKGRTAKDEASIYEQWQLFEPIFEKACSIALSSTSQEASSNTRLLDALVLAFYENPQREFHEKLHASLIQKSGKHFNCGIKATFEAYEENKGKLGTNAKSVNDKKSMDDLKGYCNLLSIGRFPYPFTSFDVLGKQIVLYSMGTPTVEEKAETPCTINSILAYWKKLKDKANSKCIFNNLQPLQADTSTFLKKIEKLSGESLGTKYEPRRSAALKKFFKEVFMSYPTDGTWYDGGNEGNLSIAIIMAEAINVLTNLEDHPIVHYPKEWGQAYHTAVREALTLVCDVLFPNKDFLSKEERKVFNECTKPFLVLNMMIMHDPDLFTIFCRDGMDRTGILKALTKLLVDIMNGNISVENKANTANSLYKIIERLCSATFLTAEQAIEDGSGRRTRLLGCWKQFGLSLDKHEIEDASVLERLINHKTFKKLKEQLKIA